jgi:hypothetical protein
VATDRIEDAANRGLHSIFEDGVFPAELSAVAGRSPAATRPPDRPRGLPDFARCWNAAEPQSPFFQHTLQLLEDPEQDRRWDEWASQDPARRHAGLTGLALSGGGVRSSTLNLGIVQVLQRVGLFQCIDYLSTVSGGGYVGSSISTNYSELRKGAAPGPLTPEKKLKRANERFPYRHERGTPEPVGFLQLRDYSSFLVPRGFIDYLKLPVQLIRGVVVNVLVLLPWIILFAVASSLLMRVDGDRAAWLWNVTITESWAGQPFPVTLRLVLLFLLLAVVFPVARRLELMSGRGPMMGRFRSLYESAMVFVLIGAGGMAWVELQPVAVSGFRGWIDTASAGVGAAAGILATFGYKFAKQIKYVVGRWALYIVAALGVLAFWFFYLLFTSWLLFPDRPSWWPPEPFASPLILMLPIAIVLLIWSFTLVSANALSMHNFYRDRLCQAFLFRVNEKTGTVDAGVDPKLSELSDEIGPLHLVNTALNTRELPERFRRGRHCEPFFLSSLYSGSRITGYCRTRKLEEAQSDLSLSTAVATSGAAVTSSMGVYTNAALRFILSVLNVRLGYWILNPMYFDPNRRTLAMRIGRLFSVGVGRFFQELLGLITYRTSYVYLSDGGHIENLGIYELIRRQCRLIIVGDGECDPAYTFQGLADALRLVRVDFGINIEMDGLDRIRNGEQQFARGTIEYPGGRRGYLVYLKSSLLGDDMVQATISPEAYLSSALRADNRRFDELGYIAHYKVTHPAFPQEPTGDQFFNETQFEVYRALGYLIADRAFSKESGPLLSESLKA